MVTDTDYGVYTAVLFMMPLLIGGVVASQLFADRYHNKTHNRQRDRYTTFLLYAVYISGLCCGIDGFLLHAATSVVWCETIGLIPCFALLGLSKVFVYAFFLRRAKLAQGVLLRPCLKTLFKYMAPIYLFLYWMIYSAVAAVAFSGLYSHGDGVAISNCNIKPHGWAGKSFSLFAGFVELFNSIFTVSIFSYPLIRAIHEAKLLGGSSEVDHKTDERIRAEFISVMKWNVFLTGIASLSSVSNLFALIVAGHYIWLFCLGDPLINAICVFLMIAPNREYVAYRFGCSRPKKTEPEKKVCSKQSTNSSQLASEINCTPQTMHTAHSESERSLPNINIDIVSKEDAQAVVGGAEETK